MIQIDPLPIPILRPSAPASIKFLACAAVTTENGQKCNTCKFVTKKKIHILHFFSDKVRMSRSAILNYYSV